MTKNADATEGLTRALRHDAGKPTYHLKLTQGYTTVIDLAKFTKTGG